MPLTRDQVKPGVRVRVIRNRDHACDPWDSESFLKSGDVIDLDGGFDDDVDVKGIFVTYAVDDGEGTNYINIRDIELVDPKSDADPVADPAPAEIVVGSALSRLGARIDAMHAELSAELAKLRAGLDAIRAEIEARKDDGR